MMLLHRVCDKVLPTRIPKMWGLQRNLISNIWPDMAIYTKHVLAAGWPVSLFVNNISSFNVLKRGHASICLFEFMTQLFPQVHQISGKMEVHCNIGTQIMG